MYRKRKTNSGWGTKNKEEVGNTLFDLQILSRCFNGTKICLCAQPQVFVCALKPHCVTCVCLVNVLGSSLFVCVRVLRVCGEA